ncbi:MAG: putative DNA binding domain-containing protein, partial [Clostridiales Family XIII bacterium]|nr:putative DNA binding domain-containing protein [Clostridiales Family XIII bacterium]
MTAEKLRTVLAVGETIAVEFKRCGNGIGADTYETICAFLNRFGGDIYLGVEDDGTVCGIPKNAAPTLIKNLIGVVGNPEMINPTVYLAPEIVEYEGKWIVHVHVPPSSEVHSCKRTIYDRVDDADIKVTATSRIALLYIRKQSIFTEKRVYPYVREEDLRFDLLPRVRRMAINRFPGHPWKDLSDADLLQSAGLHGEDKATGERGYNLAAVMLLGSDTLIRSVVPAYRTDAIVRKVNVDRYDDRLLVTTNLIDSNEQLMGFAEKHLWDKFYIEGDARISLRSAIAREMLVNTLIHREFTSAYIAKFVIEKDKMYVENANRAVKCGAITLEDYEPNPKNPIIAAFFRNIGLADELGSGVRNLCKYGRRYSGKDPALIDGDVFRIIVPLDDGYSFDAESVKAQIKRNLSAKCVLAETVETVEFQAKSQDKAQNKAQVEAGSKAQNKAQVKRSLDEGCAPAETAVLSFLRKNPQATQADTA